MPVFQLNVDTYGRKSHLYLLQLWICIVYLFIDIHDHQSPNPYISTLYILDKNPRLKSHTICVMYLYYILILLVSGYCPHTSKMGRCSNLLESTPARIPLIESSQKWNGLLFIISNSKLGIWICSQSRRDVNAQSNLYDVMTLYYTRLFPNQYTKLHTWNTLYIKFLQVLVALVFKDDKGGLVVIIVIP